MKVKENHALQEQHTALMTENTKAEPDDDQLEELKEEVWVFCNCVDRKDRYR